MQMKILFLGFLMLALAGCATSTRYDTFTNQQFPPKDQYYAVNVYPDSQSLAATNPYYVIGKISIEGFASNGVSPETLTNQAKIVARKKGADALINLKTEEYRYYGDELLRIKGDLVVYASSVTKH